MEIEFVDLFCGIGGVRLGLEKANKTKREETLAENSLRPTRDKPDSEGGTRRCGTYRCVWANDNDRYACQIYRNRFAGDGELQKDAKAGAGGQGGGVEGKQSGKPKIRRGNTNPEGQKETLQGRRRKGTQTRRDIPEPRGGDERWRGDKQPPYGDGWWDEESNLYEGDIRAVDADAIPEHDLLCAGFPCQSFSIAGKRKGFEDTRGTLFFEICRVIRAKRPGYLFLENVKGLLSHDDGNTFQTIIGTLDELGYDCQWQVLNSKDFGVPQNRERVFIVGHSRNKPRPKVFPLGEAGQTYPEGYGRAGEVPPAGQDTQSQDGHPKSPSGDSRLNAPPDEDISTAIDANYGKGWLDHGQRTMVAMRTRSSQPYQEGEISPPLRQSDKAEVRIVHENKSGQRTPHGEAQALRSGASHNYQTIVASIKPEIASRGVIKICDTRGFKKPKSWHYPEVYGEVSPREVEILETILRKRRRLNRETDGGAISLEDIDATKEECDTLVGKRYLKEINGKYDLYRTSGRIQDWVAAPKTAPTVRAEHHNTADVHFIEVAQALQTDGQLRQGVSWGTDKPQSSRNIRRLTPLECERLQGFPDGWTEYGKGRVGDRTVIGVHLETYEEDGEIKVQKVQDFGKSKNGIIKISDTQRYKCLGNAVTVNVIEAIGRQLLGEIVGQS